MLWPGAGAVGAAGVGRTPGQATRGGAAALEYGIVGVNTGATSHESAPFGGGKESGVGREGGREGIGEFLETKYMCNAGISPMGT